ncbi:MAG: hypothetical protein AB1782_21130 [Cyanobacteriota bacterium]
MEFKTEKDIISKENIKYIYDSNKVELIGNFAIDKIYTSIKNSHLVISIWNNGRFLGFCHVISDGIFFGRIQELIIHPELKEKEDQNIITDMLLHLFDNCPNLKTFHLNPGVHEKKTIYKHKHFVPSSQLKRLYWSIHEDEF